MQIAALRVQAQKPPRGELQEKYAPVQNRRCSLERSFSKLVKKHICRYHSGMKVMVVGSGGREHAISWALAKSPRVDTVVCVPGNGGTAYETKCVNIDPAAYSCPPQLGELERYVYIATQEGCALAVIGPEAPLAAGLADMLEDAGIPAVGPRKQAAQLEASKDAAKQFMKKYGIACAKSESFRDPEQAHKYIDEQGAPIVIKADGLAAGKGVVVAKTADEAHAAVRDFMERGSLGSAGATVIIEEYLTGTEISMFAAVCAAPKLTDAARSCITPLMYARDHKRLHDGAQGPNTGGMGAVAPLTDITARQYDDFIQYIYMPTFAGIVAEGWDYRGFLFFGLMLTKDGPKLLEYNVRLETLKHRRCCRFWTATLQNCARELPAASSATAASHGSRGLYVLRLPFQADTRAGIRQASASVSMSHVMTRNTSKYLSQAHGQQTAASLRQAAGVYLPLRHTEQRPRRRAPARMKRSARSCLTACFTAATSDSPARLIRHSSRYSFAA